MAKKKHSKLHPNPNLDKAKPSYAKMIPLGFGKYVRADRIFAIEPIRDERGSGARTRVWIEGIADPLVASRSSSPSRALSTGP